MLDMVKASEKIITDTSQMAIPPGSPEQNEEAPAEDKRFNDNGDGTVTDNTTGLIWLKHAVCLEIGSWEEAVKRINALNQGGNFYCGDYPAGKYNDWRLPTVKELLSLIDYSYYAPAVCNSMGKGQCNDNDPFYDLQPLIYWSSTTDAYKPENAWFVNFGYGNVRYAKKINEYYIWAVRGRKK
jgi:hypothetical protein